MGARFGTGWGSRVSRYRTIPARCTLLWDDSLRQLLNHANDRNVLKLRKQRAEELAELTKQHRTTAAQPHVQTTLQAMDAKVRVARKSNVQKPQVSSTTRITRVVSKDAMRRASWKVYHLIPDIVG